MHFDWIEFHSEKPDIPKTGDAVFDPDKQCFQVYIEDLFERGWYWWEPPSQKE